MNTRVVCVLAAVVVTGFFAHQLALPGYLMVAAAVVGSYWAFEFRPNDLEQRPEVVGTNARLSSRHRTAHWSRGIPLWVIWPSTVAAFSMPIFIPARAQPFVVALLVAGAIVFFRRFVRDQDRNRDSERDRLWRWLTAMLLALAALLVLAFVASAVLRSASLSSRLYPDATTFVFLAPRGTRLVSGVAAEVYSRAADAFLLFTLSGALLLVCRLCTAVIEVKSKHLSLREEVATKGQRSFREWTYSTSHIATFVFVVISGVRLVSLLQWIKLVSRNAPLDQLMLTTNRSGRRDIPPKLTEWYWIVVLAALALTVLPPASGGFAEMQFWLRSQHPEVVRFIAGYFYCEGLSWVLYYNFFRLFYEGTANYTIFHRLEYLLLHPIIWGVQLFSIALIGTLGIPDTVVRGPADSIAQNASQTHFVLDFLLPERFGGDPLGQISRALYAVTGVVMSVVALAYLVNGLPQPRTKDEQGVRRGVTIIGSGNVVRKIIPAMRQLWRMRSEDSGPIRLITREMPREHLWTEIRDKGESMSIEVGDGADFMASVSTAVVIATPTVSHLSIASAAVARLRFCAVEKPMCGPGQIGKMRELLQEAGARRLFCLSYYAQEKALPLVVLLLHVALDAQKDRPRSTGSLQHHAAFRRAIEFYGPFVGPRPEYAGESLEAVAHQLGKVRSSFVQIHETVERSPTGSTDRVWTEIDPERSGGRNGGTLFETAVHAQMIDQLARYACMDPKACGIRSEWILAKHRERLARFEAGDLTRSQGGACEFHSTWIRARAEAQGLTFEIDVKKFAAKHQRHARVEFEHGFAEMDFDSGEMSIELRNSNEATMPRSIVFARAYASADENYLTMMAMFHDFVRRGGFEPGARWDLSLIQLDCLEILEAQVSASLSAHERY